MGQVAFPSLSSHSRMACRSNVRPDLVMIGSTKTSNVRGQMNSGGTTVELEFGILRGSGEERPRKTRRMISLDG